MGITRHDVPRATTRASRKTPAAPVERRVRAPLTFTLMIVWPIIAHPAMPPKKPVRMFATPCAHDSRPLSDGVSVMSSTSSRSAASRAARRRQACSAYGSDDRERVQIEGHARNAEHRQALGQGTLIANGRHVDTRDDGEDREQHDRDQWRRHRPGEPGEGVHHRRDRPRPWRRPSRARCAGRGSARRRSGSRARSRSPSSRNGARTASASRSRDRPSTIWIPPARMVAASRYCDTVIVHE